MGNTCFGNKSNSRKLDTKKVSNIHEANADIKIHTVVTGELDDDHAKAMTIPLGEVTDEQLMAEVARRHLDIHDKITDKMSAKKAKIKFFYKKEKNLNSQIKKILKKII